MQLQPRERVLFIGDSITDCGRRRPIGEGLFDQALGSGYVALVASSLTAAYPDYGVQVVNMGIGGNTIRDLKARWETDVCQLHPHWLAVMIGINDVWRRFDSPWETMGPISREEYAETLDHLIGQTRADLSGLILMTPYYLDLNRADPMRELMDEFGASVRQTAETHDAVFVDTQTAFDRVLRWLRPELLAEDRIHVSQAGHMVLARALLQGIGYDWSRLSASAPGSA
jgi:lysophospholipase L1-like esterase